MSNTEHPATSRGPHHIAGHKDGNFVTTGDLGRFAGLPSFLRAPPHDIRDPTCYLANLVLMEFVSMTPRRR